MNAERWARITGVFRAALEKPAGERAVFLGEACGDDEALRRDVENLLAGEAEPSLPSPVPEFLEGDALELAPGEMLAHYRLEAKIGEGGMGAVYRAYDKQLHRKVALKLLPPHTLADPDRKGRLMREARAASALNHPNIITIYEVGSDRGVDFIAMEFVSGKTLSRLIGRKGLPLRDALNHVVQIASALAAAHRAGIVHRDLKPANIVVNDAGQVKVLDFGLAKRTERGPEGAPREETASTHTMAPETDTGVVLGTVAYMSPEQAEGKKLDGRSDIFSSGAVLYEMLTGIRAFERDSTAATLAAILKEEPTPASELVANLPPQLEVILTRCLRKDPARRFQHMDDLKVALEELREASDSAALAAAGPSRPRQRRRLLWIAAALACLTSLVWMGSGWVKYWVRSWGLPARKHVAVLPFRNIGGDAGQQAFCDGLTETVTTALTRLGSLSVVPATDARKLVDAEAARREFGVNLVVAGTVQRRGDAVRVVINLIDAGRRRQIGSEPLDLPEGRLFELEDGVLGKMADLLNVLSSQQSPNLAAAGASQLPGAHDAYLRGRGFLYRYDRAGNLEQAIREFESAVRKDPRFALAYVGLAEARFRQYSPLRDPDILEAARLAAHLALELNPRLASAHTWHGTILAESGQRNEGVKELQTAVGLDPNDPAGYRELARVYRAQARPLDAERVFMQAIGARPGDWMAYSDLAAFYNSRQRYREAESQFRKVLELTPDNPYGYRNLAAVLIRLGKNREAEAMLRKALDLRPLARTYTNLGALLMFEGRYADAVPVMEKAAEIGSREAPRDYRIWGNLGDAYWLAKLPREKESGAWRRAVEIAEPQLTGGAGDAELLSLLAKYHSKLGDRANALRRVASALRLAPSSAVVRYQAGLVFALLGDRLRALSELEVAAGLKYSIEEIRQAPELVTLHQSPEFQKLISQTR